MKGFFSFTDLRGLMQASEDDISKLTGNSTVARVLHQSLHTDLRTDKQGPSTSGTGFIKAWKRKRAAAFQK